MLDMAKLLKGTANVFMAGVLVKQVAQDFAVEVRDDAARYPYRAAGAATVLGIWAGTLLVKQRRKRSSI